MRNELNIQNKKLYIYREKERGDKHIQSKGKFAWWARHHISFVIPRESSVSAQDMERPQQLNTAFSGQQRLNFSDHQIMDVNEQSYQYTRPLYDVGVKGCGPCGCYVVALICLRTRLNGNNFSTFIYLHCKNIHVNLPNYYQNGVKRL